jgi:hypothetical protein
LYLVEAVRVAGARVTVDKRDRDAAGSRLDGKRELFPCLLMVA